VAGRVRAGPPAPGANGYTVGPHTAPGVHPA
jgi:hypothetical protein